MKIIALLLFMLVPQVGFAQYPSDFSTQRQVPPRYLSHLPQEHQIEYKYKVESPQKFEVLSLKVKGMVWYYLADEKYIYKNTICPERYLKEILFLCKFWNSVGEPTKHTPMDLTNTDWSPSYSSDILKFQKDRNESWRH